MASAGTGRLAGKVAIITGAARGQGAAEARLFVAEGASVLIADVLDDQGGALADELGPGASFVHLDVTDEDGWAAALAACVDAFGTPDVLVNNAGIVRFAEVVSTSLAEFRQVMDINLVGTFLGIRTVAPAMVEAGGGSIVNISSSSGMVGFPLVSAYAASKWAVRGLTKSAALELGPKGVRVNSVHPGGVDTPMTRAHGTSLEDFAPFTDRLPLKRLGTVDDVAPLVLYLASDESSYCTGSEFVVDGGQTCGDPGLLGS